MDTSVISFQSLLDTVLACILESSVGQWQTEKHRETDKAMAHCQHRFIQEKKPAEESPAREREPTATYRLGFRGKEGPGDRWGDISPCGLSSIYCWG
jgi:hypothetical protein